MAAKKSNTKVFVSGHVRAYIHCDERLADMFATTLDGSKFSSPSKRKMKTCPLHYLYLFSWLDCHSGPRPPHCSGSAITLRHTTFGRTPLDEWSARRRDLYLTTHNTHYRHTSNPHGWIQDCKPSKRKAAHPRLSLRGHWARLNGSMNYIPRE